MSNKADGLTAPVENEPLNDQIERQHDLEGSIEDREKVHWDSNFSISTQLNRICTSHVLFRKKRIIRVPYKYAMPKTYNQYILIPEIPRIVCCTGSAGHS
jgi:hypothetical protein